MTNPLKYKSVAIKHETYKKLKVISKRWIDLELSLAQTVTMLTDMMYAKVTDKHFVAPLRGNAEYQQKKRQMLFQASSEKLKQMDS